MMSDLQLSPEETERWQSGAARFQAFVKDEVVKGELLKLDEQDVGPLKLLFLGEKPSIAFSPSPAISEALRKEGFGMSATFVYDLAVCKAEMIKHKDLFHDFTDVEAVFTHLDKEFCRDESSIDTVRAGVLLGFPRSDSEGYRQIYLQRQHLHDELRMLLDVSTDQLHEILLYKCNMTPKYDRISGSKELVLRKDPPHEIVPGLSEDRIEQALQMWRSRSVGTDRGTGVNVHGMAWTRFGESPESLLKEERLKTAMRVSGILDL